MVARTAGSVCYRSAVGSAASGFADGENLLWNGAGGILIRPRLQPVQARGGVC